MKIGVEIDEMGAGHLYMLLLYMKHGKLPHRLIYVHGITAHHCYIWNKCFLVAVLLTKNVDNINRTLDLSKLHQYHISLLRKTQNTFPEPAVSGIWLMGKFS